MMKLILNPLIKLALLASFLLTLNGCLSHYFLESSTRLQVENATKDCSIISINVLSEDGLSSKPWLRETVLPGERSLVVEEDWVGEFKLEIKYTKSVDATGDTLSDIKEFEFEGGSLYLMVENHKDSLYYRFR